jgi:hypothetical protein
MTRTDLTTDLYQVNLWQQQHWRRADRFYSCELCQDLFGHWTVRQRWGGAFTGKGGHQEQACDSYEEALQRFNAVSKRRQQRGYSVW